MKENLRNLPLGQSRRLHLGCGPHALESPWENFDREVDITKPLPFDDDSAEYIFAEHVIEHVPFPSAMRFLRECYRVLHGGGVLRVSFPDVGNFNDANTPLYQEFMRSISRRAESVGDVARFILEGSGHQAAWTATTGQAALFAVGFPPFDVFVRHYGRSPHVVLDGIDGHHLTSSLTAATIETTVLEATK